VGIYQVDMTRPTCISPDEKIRLRWPFEGEES
jgi:hypothetical protein